MQLFVTSPNPAECVRVMDDKRVVNQVRETGQLLCTAIRLAGLHHPALMKSTHVNHPVSIWVRASYSNWIWTYRHFEALAHEHKMRYPKSEWHKNWRELNGLLLELGPDSLFPSGPGLTPFANCAKRDDLGIDFTDEPNVHIAYEKYLCARWQREQPRWTNRPEPVFYDYT